jgi:hypothetical protein
MEEGTSGFRATRIIIKLGVAFILDLWWGLPGFQVQKLTQTVKRLFRNIVVLSIAYLWPGR